MIIDPAALAEGVAASSRAAVARAITLVESSRPDHRALARELLAGLEPPARMSWRVGISGVPGVGKSTLVESLGMALIRQGHRVGVLAVDPSSVRTGGSVLGDKTRMTELAANDAAYIRPSPTAGTLGGVARATAQALTVLEAAGYDVILIETVGVGQSEITVAGLVDTFLLLTLARSGDQLQGIKKGVLEIADVVAVNKADGEYARQAASAARDLAGALRLVSGPGAWVPPALTCSGLTGEGVDRVWENIGRHRESLGTVGLASKRSSQQWAFVQRLVQEEVLDRLRRSPAVTAATTELRAQVLAGDVPAVTAADRLLAAYDGTPDG
ncbi:methylmalonyl Co-A mutase-associated GTPase MeaB [Nakamurella silvestris]|nr:methylmalonyl Co-A mutase-associated GTPase MeaB [Nakamurella silvestris]